MTVRCDSQQLTTYECITLAHFEDNGGGHSLPSAFVQEWSDYNHCNEKENEEILKQQVRDSTTIIVFGSTETFQIEGF